MASLIVEILLRLPELIIVVAESLIIVVAEASIIALVVHIWPGILVVGIAAADIDVLIIGINAVLNELFLESIIKCFAQFTYDESDPEHVSERIGRNDLISHDSIVVAILNGDALHGGRALNIGLSLGWLNGLLLTNHLGSLKKDLIFEKFWNF